MFQQFQLSTGMNLVWNLTYDYYCPYIQYHAAKLQPTLYSVQVSACRTLTFFPVAKVTVSSHLFCNWCGQRKICLKSFVWDWLLYSYAWLTLLDHPRAKLLHKTFSLALASAATHIFSKSPTHQPYTVSEYVWSQRFMLYCSPPQVLVKCIVTIYRYM